MNLTRLIKRLGGETSPDSDHTILSGQGTTGIKAASNDIPSDITSPVWRPGEVMLGRYRVEEVMGGAMGSIYIVHHLGWGVKMVIKVPRPEVLRDKEGVARMMKEANAWIRMGMHPNIACCYYILTLDKIPHLFIEYVDGGNLADWLKAGRLNDLRTVLSLAIQFCHGMEYTHSQGIIHRDIKPQNILISKEALVKITDFGILRMTNEEAQAKKALPHGIKQEEDLTVGFMGTPGYAAPEQWQDAHNVDERADIFSFGLCLWMMFCGRKPFPHTAERLPVPEPRPAQSHWTFPSGLTDLLVKCVAFERNERFPHFAALRAELNRVYQTVFQVPCPYYFLDFSDLRADGLNNRGVSFYELGREDEAMKYFEQALEINDFLPEAIHNLTLLKVRNGKLKPQRALRLISASKKRLVRAEILAELESKIKKKVLNEKDKAIANGQDCSQSELRLCMPPRSADIYREGQLLLAVKRNIGDHIANKRYAAGFSALFAAWKNAGFKKDNELGRAYRELLSVGQETDLAGVQRVRTIALTDDAVCGLAFSADARLLVAATRNGKIWFKPLGQEETKKGIVGYEAGVNSLAINPKGTFLITGATDGIVSLWQLDTIKKCAATKNHNGTVRCVAVSDDGCSIASGGDDGILRVREFQPAREKKFAMEEACGIVSLAFIPRTGFLVAGNADGSIRFWERESQRCTMIIEAHSQAVVGLSVSPDGKLLATGSSNRLLKIWNAQTGRCLKQITAHEEGITAVLFPDNRHVITGCDDDTVKIWHSVTGDCLQVLEGRGEGICSLARGPWSQTFAAGRKDGAVVVWMLIYQLEFAG